jgi:hypothetical protein
MPPHTTPASRDGAERHAAPHAAFLCEPSACGSYPRTGGQLPRERATDTPGATDSAAAESARRPQPATSTASIGMRSAHRLEADCGGSMIWVAPLSRAFRQLGGFATPDQILQASAVISYRIQPHQLGPTSGTESTRRRIAVRRERWARSRAARQSARQCGSSRLMPDRRVRLQRIAMLPVAR